MLVCDLSDTKFAVILHFCSGTDISTMVTPIGMKFCTMVDMGPRHKVSPSAGYPQGAPKSPILTANISKTVSRSVTCQLYWKNVQIYMSTYRSYSSGCSGLVVKYRIRNREVAGSTHTRSTASNLEQAANLLCAQANSVSYPQRDGK